MNKAIPSIDCQRAWRTIRRPLRPFAPYKFGSAMLSQTSAEQLIRSNFDVPYVHRLCTTTDVFGEEQNVLQRVLEPTESQTTRVLCVVDGDVLDARLDLEGLVSDFFRSCPATELVADVLRVQGGEAIKNSLSHLESILEAIHTGQLDRRSYVLVIGGGAVLDAVGFAAAIAHRGVRLIRIPTTTLAQADSGVGVKNSVNLFGQKNWIGTFAVPWAVINDTAMLRTLPDREFRCGFSEAVKVALLKDPQFFDSLCEDAERIADRDLEVAADAIHESAKHHLRHITEGGDPFERLEARPLDFGHWSAHKLEVLSGFGLRHGEAVGIGVAVDTVYSGLKFGMPESDVNRVLACLKHLQIPLSHPQLENTAALFDGLDEFRQHLGGRLTLTMLNGVGDAHEIHEVDEVAMREAIARVIAESATNEPPQKDVREARL